MNIINSFWGTGAEPTYNTYIGGIGATTTTASALETLLGLSGGDVTEFSIDGSNNISAFIDTTYTLPTTVFSSNTEITYFVDEGGICNAVTGTDHFFACSNLLYINMGGTFSANAPIIRDCPLLEYVILANATGTIYCRQAELCEFLYAPNATTLAGFGLWDAESIDSVNLPSVTTIGTNAIRDIAAKIILEFDVLTTYTSTSSLYFLTNASTKVLLPSVTTFGGSGMARSFGGTLVIPSVSTNIGGVATDSQTFLNCSANTVVYAHNSLATNNGGGMDGDLDYVVNTRGGTVIFITDTTPPSAITDLNYTNVTSSSVDLTFSTPSSTNAIDHYDVYIDTGNGAGYRLLDEVTTTGDTTTFTLPSATEINIKVRTIDEFYNRSGFSNEITFTTA